MNITQKDHLTPADLYKASVFAVQNRHLGIRHNIEEAGEIEPLRGSFINGFFDLQPIHYGEKAYGFPLINESMVGVPDAQTIELWIEGEPVHYQTANVLSNIRTFDLKNGCVHRHTLYDHPRFGRIHIKTRRFVSAFDQGLFLNEWRVEVESYEGQVTIKSTLEINPPQLDSNDPRAGQEPSNPLDILELSPTKTGGLAYVKTQETDQYCGVYVSHQPALAFDACSSKLRFEDRFYLSKDSPLTCLKTTVYHVDKGLPSVAKALKRWVDQPSNWDQAFTSHQEQLKTWFSGADFSIDTGDDAFNEAIHYNVHQLATAGANHEFVSIPAKGLTGKGYHGHTFWDTEMYMVPYFMLHEPSQAYQLIRYRYHQLADAAHEARLLGARRGVKFAWRTITGKETSGYYAAGSAQYHINSAIVYAIIQIYTLHQNHSWFEEIGWPILLETARFFVEVIADDGHQCHLNNVTGPDEYSAVVNDNFYTNQMIVFQMTFMLDILQRFPVLQKDLGDDFYSAEEELEGFKRIKERLVLLHDETLDIDLQDNQFLQRAPWDFKASAGRHPLLLHYHPLTIYRHQVLKQADTVLAHFLLQNRPPSTLLNSYRYYLDKTTHDSSLSKCIYAGMAARLQQMEEALALYRSTLRIDLDNTHKNTLHGLHVANLGGVHLGLWFGFLGLKIYPRLSLNPHWPASWTTFKGHFFVKESIKVTINIDPEDCHLSATEPVEIWIYDTKHVLDSTPQRIPLNRLNKAN